MCLKCVLVMLFCVVFFVGLVVLKLLFVACIVSSMECFRRFLGCCFFFLLFMFLGVLLMSFSSSQIESGQNYSFASIEMQCTFKAENWNSLSRHVLYSCHSASM